MNKFNGGIKMTDLGCSVTNCTYNEDRLCCRREIKVGGKSARDCSDTCCCSYVEKGCGCAKNSSMEPGKKTEIACDATNCTYNNSMVCHAPHVNVKTSKDVTHGETECASFRM